jgi:flagellin-like hook-associated protein FlgL
MSLYEAAGGTNLADAGDNLSQTTYYDAAGNIVLQGLSTNSTFNFIVNNNSATQSSAQITIATTWQDVVDQINQSTAVNTLIEANFDNATGRFSITALNDSVENIQWAVGVTANATNSGYFDIGMGDPTGNRDPLYTASTAGGTYEQVISFNSSTETLDNLARDYNVIREQIDQLTFDANYRGINLLAGDVLTTYFNEDNSSLLETEGADLTANGLGLTEAVFRTEAGIAADLVRVQSALNDVRAFATTLANSLSVIQTRRDFTESTIAVLKAGSEDLTVADQNEEGANLLALQTRQQLGVTSLALASQSQQSVLRLF